MFLAATMHAKELMTMRLPFGPGFSDHEAARAIHMELWATNFLTDPPPEYWEYVLLDEDGAIFARRRFMGSIWS
jgi:hypothetical protein